MLTFALVFAVLWVAQMLLMWRQANVFRRAVTAMSSRGRVVTGMNRRHGLRTFVAIAVRDGIVTDARILKGFTVFAKPTAAPVLVGIAVVDLAGGTRADGISRRVSAAAAHASSLYLAHTARTRPVSVTR
ncbi:transcriptional regulator GutM [Nocardia sp. NPDC050630]|uniref:transcriptional regulator GutM n=1 Tax=Nocardia sp. NPDC050630 TaxID=3364321 RepID=UPI003793718C